MRRCRARNTPQFGGGRFKTIRGGFGRATTGSTLLGFRTRLGIVFLPPDRRRPKPKKGDHVLLFMAAQGMIDDRGAFCTPNGSTPFSGNLTALLPVDG